MSTLLLPGFCCCWRPWSPSFLAVDCFPSVTDEPFFAGILNDIGVPPALAAMLAVAGISAVVSIPAVAASTAVAGFTAFGGVPFS